MFRVLALMATVFLSTVVAHAGEHEIRMITTQSGEMLFDPDFVRAEPGDMLRFVPTDRTHNAETLRGMLPERAQPFKGEIGEDFTVTLTQEGVYGIVCKSHYAMGMVMTVVVGEPVNLEQAMRRPHPAKAKAVFDGHFEALRQK